MDDDAVILLMLALADTPALTREVWVDHVLLGIPQTTLADRHGVSRARIWQRVHAADTRVRRYLHPRRRTQPAGALALPTCPLDNQQKKAKPTLSLATSARASLPS